MASAGDRPVDRSVDRSPVGGRQPDNARDGDDTPTENLGNLGILGNLNDPDSDGTDLLLTVPVMSPVPPPAPRMVTGPPRHRWRPSLGRFRSRSGKPNRSLPLTLSMAFLLLAIALGARTWRSHTDGTPAASGAGPATTTSAPASPSSTGIDLTRPFTTTPAVTWADGADGILPPPAAPVGAHSATDVAAAYGQVKEALVAAHLDLRMLVSHDPSAYLALLAPATRMTERGAITGSKDPDEGGEVSLFAPGFHLLPVPIKVSGTMTASTDQRGLLVVHANFVYAFPFAPTDRTRISEAWQIVAVQHVAEDFTVVAGRTYRAADRGLWVTSSQSYDESIACTASKHGYLAPAYSEPQQNAHGDGDPDAYFDPKHNLAINTTCPP